MTETYGNVRQMTKCYGESRNGVIFRYGAHVPFNFLLTGLADYYKPIDFVNNIKLWINNMPVGIGIHANWVVSESNGNHQKIFNHGFLQNCFIFFVVGESRSTKNCETIRSKKNRCPEYFAENTSRSHSHILCNIQSRNNTLQ